MITHDELSKALYETYRAQATKVGGDMREWQEQSIAVKQCWSAVAFTAWELVEGENAIWAEAASRKEEELRELVVKFINRAESVLE
jgi:hypothetical protein